MAKQSTNTSENTLPEQGFYDIATVESVKKKKIKEVYTAYQWTFSTAKGNVSILMFSSAMGELLKALGAIETSPNNFDWDDEEVIGKHISFNLLHKEIKGQLRAVLSDIKEAKSNDAWGE